ncbi:MAG: precorrin-3B C(17)-methyltransferase [Desulfobacterales bacterium C00003060]|nr:MAG: precorrin-3B C(17)-methyltransferase [Desulfobacterales bacterium S3730MH5]OEU80331.1 MAG: precorrin-3B C(17)-methyltransferase [Desulfobacterales bacterium C00003060]OEU84012.1 MAG: precorrin-3B C(17)-methyltransferase [Desulfobacterales bacterium S5133MH4]
MYVVGLGPGDPAYLSERAVEVLHSVQVVVGYKTYITLIEALLVGKEVVSTGMRTEMDRVNIALDHAFQGRDTAIVSSGDAGIYGMAGLVLEMCRQKHLRVALAARTSAGVHDVILEIVPGIPALCAAAALVGAPLMHDFVSISLSDLLTPWAVIVNRLTHAAKADFVLVLYNPKSKKRDWQLRTAQEILLKYRDKDTPVGLAKKAMRPGQQVHIATLSEMHTMDVDMQTIMIVGNSKSYVFEDLMITPRGYLDKYPTDNS